MKKDEFSDSLVQCLVDSLAWMYDSKAVPAQTVKEYIYNLFPNDAEVLSDEVYKRYLAKVSHTAEGLNN